MFLKKIMFDKSQLNKTFSQSPIKGVPELSVIDPHRGPHHAKALAVNNLKAGCPQHQNKSEFRMTATGEVMQPCSLLQHIFMSSIINFSPGYVSHFLLICVSSNFIGYWTL